VRELAGYGCLTRMHVVRLLAPRVENEDHTKDVDFSPDGIRRRWEAGYENACRAIALAPWRGEFGPLDGVILHEPRAADEVRAVVGDATVAVQRGDALAVDADATAV
jgi:NTE family protein